MKKPVIKNMDEVLAKLPEDEREKARATVLEMFKDYDPANPPGRRVLRLASNETVCQSCSAALVLVHKHTFQMPDLPNLGEDRGKVVEYSDCSACKQPFLRVAGS